MTGLRSLYKKNPIIGRILWLDCYRTITGRLRSSQLRVQSTLKAQITIEAQLCVIECKTYNWKSGPSRGESAYRAERCSWRRPLPLPPSGWAYKVVSNLRAMPLLSGSSRDDESLYMERDRSAVEGSSIENNLLFHLNGSCGGKGKSDSRREMKCNQSL